jgi:hypothetical protein
MPEQQTETHTVADLVAESERIRERAATIMAEIKAILQEMGDRNARASLTNEGGRAADE